MSRRNSSGGTPNSSTMISFCTPERRSRSRTSLAWASPAMRKSPISAIGPLVKRANASTLATRLVGLRNTGRCRFVRCVQVVCELPQVTHS